VAVAEVVVMAVELVLEDLELAQVLVLLLVLITLLPLAVAVLAELM